ncbi:MAG TPA: glycosyltransferase family 39 protein [Thermoanaerobaculia bacterium]
MSLPRELSRNAWLAAIAALTIVACVRVGATWRVFAATSDEPVHVFAGYNWFDGKFSDPSHPPLARILFGLPLRLAHYPRPVATDDSDAGNELLYHDRYERSLARTRAGNLPLLILGIITVAWWSRRLFSYEVSVLAVAFFTTLPPILGNAGLATTDMAIAATLPFALLALDLFLEQSSPRRAVFLGVAVALGLLSKISFLLFFPAAALVLILFRRRRVAWRAVLIALAVAFFVAWAGYRFEFARPVDAAGQFAIFSFDSTAPAAWLRQPMRYVAEHVRMPAPSFAVGVTIIKLHDLAGHGAYLLGQYSDRGWWYYFPVVFFYKTPIPFLILLAWGIVRARDWPLILIPLAILLVAMTGTINIGLRHVLPVYAPLAIVAARGAFDIWRRATDAFARVTLAALLGWLFIGTGIAHPDYLAWFNELAQPNPSRVAVDSNLDWGQDVLRLARVAKEMQLADLKVDVFAAAKLSRHGLSEEPVHAGEKISGWLAVSETQVIFKERFGEYVWLRTYRPVRRIGKSIRLYHIP